MNFENKCNRLEYDCIFTLNTSFLISKQSDVILFNTNISVITLYSWANSRTDSSMHESYSYSYGEFFTLVYLN